VKRIFIAIKIEAGETLLEVMSALLNGLKNESIKWINPQNVHLTLAFLGDTDEDKISALDSMLKEKCKGFGNFEILIKGAGVFKNLNDPRVIWAGIEDSEKLVLLNNLVLKGLQEIGIEIENRAFRPHLTLGRFRHLNSGNALRDLIDRYDEMIIQKVQVSEVILFESTLLRTGPVYTIIGKYALSSNLL
jgi:RNA 2',3'-cyclic 3'-phosphodiesterase